MGSCARFRQRILRRLTPALRALILHAMRFIHTADWQIGKPFRNFGEKESVLRQARLVRARREGRSVFYALDDDHVAHMFEQGLLHVSE